MNNLLFQKEGWTYVNYGDDNIRTEIKYISPVNLEKRTSETKNNESEFNKRWYERGDFWASWGEEWIFQKIIW